MNRTRPSEYISELALADRSGHRWDRQTSSPERSQRLADEVELATAGEEKRREIATRHAAGESVRQIADEVQRDPSTVSRGIDRAVLVMRACLLATLVDEWLTLCGGCLISMRTSKPLNWTRNAYLVASPDDRLMMMSQPNQSRINLFIRRQRDLLKLASNVKANHRDPHIACWQDHHTKKWCIEFPLVCADRNEAVIAANETGVSHIFHIASGQIEHV